MQSCPDEILDMIAAVLHERFSYINSFGQVNDLCNFALTSKRMARVTQRHRFHTVHIDSKRNNEQMLKMIRRNPTLLAQTTKLVLNQPSQWMTSYVASVIMDHLTSVRCLALLNLFINPDFFKELNGATRMFEHIRELRIAFNIDLHETLDLFRLLRLFPRLEVLQLNIETLRVQEWDEASSDVKSDLKKTITTPIPRPLRQLHLRSEAWDYPNQLRFSRMRDVRGDPSPEQLRALLDQLMDSEMMGALETFGIHAEHQAHIIKFINQNSQTLRELHVHSPWPTEEYWSLPPFKWKLARLPLLRLIHVHDMAYASPTMVADLLQLLISSCTEVGDLTLRLSERDMPWNAYTTGSSPYDYSGAAGAERWEALDRFLSSLGCREVRFDMSVRRPGAHEDILASDILVDRFPQCHAQGKLKINVSFQ